jgi:hypothetical protein
MILTIKPLEATLYLLLLGHSLLLKREVAAFACGKCKQLENVTVRVKSETCDARKDCKIHHCGQPKTIQYSHCEACKQKVQGSEKIVEDCSLQNLHGEVCVFCQDAWNKISGYCNLLSVHFKKPE